MKLRYSLSSRQRLFALGFCIFLLFGQGETFAQDRLVFKDGKTQDTKILGVSGPNVQIQVGSGNVGVPLATIASVTMAPPAEFAAASKAYAAGDYAKALPVAKAVAEKFKGLPVDWARQSISLVGDIQVALGNLQEAEVAYKDFQKIYPGAGGIQMEIGLARIAVARKNYDAAKQKLDPIAAQALKSKTPNPAMGSIYSQTFYLLGQIAEGQQQPVVALENYLRTVTIYSADRATVAAAQEKADALRKKDPTLAVP